MRFAQLFSRLMLLFQEKEFWGNALDNLLWLITYGQAVLRLHSPPFCSQLANESPYRHWTRAT